LAPKLIPSKNGTFIDKKGRKVNKHGWLEEKPKRQANQSPVPRKNSLIDKHGRKKFDKSKLTEEGDIPKLYTLDGNRFDIKDTMGQFERDDEDNIVMKEDPKKNLFDKLGRQVNNKGYLVDERGNIIDKNGKKLFPKSCLLSSEFPKIFSYTKFDPKRVTGEFDREVIS